MYQNLKQLYVQKVRSWTGKINWSSPDFDQDRNADFFPDAGVLWSW